MDDLRVKRDASAVAVRVVVGMDCARVGYGRVDFFSG
jgi:hypothetical protein